MAFDQRRVQDAVRTAHTTDLRHRPCHLACAASRGGNESRARVYCPFRARPPRCCCAAGRRRASSGRQRSYLTPPTSAWFTRDGEKTRRERRTELARCRQDIAQHPGRGRSIHLGRSRRARTGLPRRLAMLVCATRTVIPISIARAAQ